MFQYEEIIGVEDKEGKIININDFNQVILLTPDMIENTVKKINNMYYGEFDNCTIGPFINGYSCVSKQNYDIAFIKRNTGKVIYFNQNIRKIMSNFSCDRALVRLENGKYAYMNGETGDLSFHFPRWINVEHDVGLFCNDLIPIRVEESKDSYQYFDQNGFPSSEIYSIASSFYQGKAIVKNSDTTWNIIDTDFKVLKSYNGNPFNTILKYAAKQYDHNEAIYQKDNVEIKTENQKVYIMDLDLGFSLRVYEVLSTLSEFFSIDLISNNPKDNLVHLVNEIAKIGTFAMDLEKMKIMPVTIKKGIKLKDEFEGSVISFDEVDVKFARARVDKK